MHESATAVIVIVAAYALGCFSTGYYLFRLHTGADIRCRGSGNTGARNVGRELGKLAFGITLLVDLIKGAIAVWTACYFEIGATGVLLTMYSVVIGHIWPIQLRFRGGKGIATALGALLLFSAQLALLLILLFSVLFVLCRNLTLAGLTAVASAPAIAALMGRSRADIIAIAILAVIILIAHRKNIQALFCPIGVNARAAKRSLASGGGNE